MTFQEKFNQLWQDAAPLRRQAKIEQFLAGVVLFAFPRVEESQADRNEVARYLERAAEELRHPDFTREYYIREFIERKG